VIKYIGSKRKLLPTIEKLVDAVPDVRAVVDLFSGTSRVGHALKRAGYRVTANDHNAYAHTLATCYVQADLEHVRRPAEQLVAECNRLRGDDGYFTETYCRRARYFRPKNGARIEAIRNAIAAKELPPELEAVMLVSLMEAADRVDSTTGVQMAYLKDWAPRADRDLELRVPDVLPRAQHGKGAATQLDARDAAERHGADLIYLDPPYNQHSYLGNYHVWESLVRWDHLPVYGVACKRVDCKERRSTFNRKREMFGAFADVVRCCRADTLVVSFNNEGYVDRADMERLLGEWSGGAEVHTIATDYKRYVGAQIGIHNPRGEKVGAVGHLRNVEYLFVASRHDLRDRLAPLLQAAR